MVDAATVPACAGTDGYSVDYESSITNRGSCCLLTTDWGARLSFLAGWAVRRASRVSISVLLPDTNQVSARNLVA